MTEIEPIYGTTKNKIPFVRFGKGQKSLQVWSGGPGNIIPKGFMLRRFTKGLEPFFEDYDIVLLTRRSNMPKGFSTRDMSDDYADYILEECGGHVDLIIGISYGGIIAQHFAADYPELVDHIVICSAAYRGSVDGMALDYRYAELLSQNKPRKALALMAGALTENKVVETMMRPFLWLIGPRFLGDGNNEVFRRDVLIEAEAELAHDGRESLDRISIPTLVLGGELDHYFPQKNFQETVDLIPGGQLKLYPNKGHDIIGDRETARDILKWVSTGEI